jgi:multidrug efflux pump subunit AcrB
MGRPGLSAALFLAFCAASAALLLPWLGRDFFPSVDSGQIKLHVRARTGTRIEETARLCDRIDASIRASIPTPRSDSVIVRSVLPYSGINLSYSNSAPASGPATPTSSSR